MTPTDPQPKRASNFLSGLLGRFVVLAVGALLVEEGQTVEVGTPIIRFGGAGDSGAEAAETTPSS